MSASAAVSDGDLLRRARQVRRLLRVGSGRVDVASFDLASIDTRSTPGLPARLPADSSKAWSQAEVVRLGQHLTAYQERLYASGQAGAGRQRLLLVLQAMDCGGKDGTVRSVVGTMDPLGVHIKAFGPPTEPESAQHFLWRVHLALPPVGYVGVFNRSHYEDVLVARVRSLVPRKEWKRRYEEINTFERDLVADGLTIVKVMLHIGHDEQRQRLLARLDDPTKHWKFRADDLDDRDLWNEYQQAYQDALTRCSTPDAPWYVVPADRKWYRNWAVANILLAHLEDMSPQYPRVDLNVAAQRARLDPAAATTGGERQVNRG